MDARVPGTALRLVGVGLMLGMFAALVPSVYLLARHGSAARKMGIPFAPFLALGALVATLVSLIVTDWVSDGLSIDGTGTWIAATVIVWLASLLAAVILPYLGLKKYLDERRD